MNIIRDIRREPQNCPVWNGFNAISEEERVYLIDK